MSDGQRLARRIVASGVLAFWVVLVVLSSAGGLPLVDAVLLAVLLAAVPALSMAQVPLIGGVHVERMPAYWSSIATLWLLGTACWLVGTREGGAPAVGLVLIGPVPLLLWTLGLTVAGLLVIVAFRQVGAWLEAGDSVLLRELLPRTASERRVFGLLSVAAGTGEELAYRGYAIPALSPLLGVTGAAVLTTLVFGAIHGYQGRLGVARTTIMGGVLAWGFLASGSLVPAIVSHVLIDVIAGIVLGDRLLSPAEGAGVWSAAEVSDP